MNSKKVPPFMSLLSDHFRASVEICQTMNRIVLVRSLEFSDRVQNIRDIQNDIVVRVENWWRSCTVLHNKPHPEQRLKMGVNYTVFILHLFGRFIDFCTLFVLLL